MSNARNLADLIASGGVIEASEIADSTITGGKLASDITISTTGSITSGGLTVDTSTLYVDSSNNRVGIGTTSPTVPLTIYNTGYAGIHLSTVNPSIRFSTDTAGSSDTTRGFIGYATNTDAFMIGSSSGDLVIRGNSTDSVLIGTPTVKTVEITGSGVTVTGDITVSGDLTVNGTTTTINTTNTQVTDNLLELNSGATANTNDAGIIIERGTTGDNAIMAWDESADAFVFGTTTATASDTGNLTITPSPIEVRKIYSDSTIGDKISLYQNRFNLTSMYGFGVESDTLYSKSATNHRWYINANADGGTSDIMELTSSQLTVNADVRIVDASDSRLYLNDTSTGTMTLGYTGGEFYINPFSSATRSVKIENTGTGDITVGIDGKLTLYEGSAAMGLHYVSGDLSINPSSSSNRSVTFENTGTGGMTVNVVGDATVSGDINLADDSNLYLGDNNDVRLWHESSTSNTYLYHGTTSPFYLRTDKFRLTNKGVSESMIQADANGEVRLYYDSSEKLNTSSTGVTVTGTVVADGLTVDTNTLHVDSTNNRVGIGTSSPSTLIDVQGTSGQLFSITDSLSGTIFSVNDISGVPSIEVLDTGNILLAELSGNVGIGTSSPGYSLDVTGDARITTDLIVDTDTLYVDSTNNRVGIGTTAPIDQLHIKTGDGTNPPVIRLEAGSGQLLRITGMYNGVDAQIRSEYGLTLNAGGTVASDMHFYINSSEKMVLSSTGYLGIGTSSPDTKLHLETSSSGSLGLKLENTSTPGESVISLFGKNSSGTVRSMVIKYDNADRFRFSTASALPLAFETNDTERMRITSSGQVIVGGTSAENSSVRLEAQDATNPILQVKDTTSNIYCGIQAGNSNAIIRAPNDAPLVFVVGAAEPEHMRITQGGLVGIGTSSPGKKLEVQGTSSNNTAVLLVENNNTSTFNSVVSEVRGGRATTSGAYYLIQATNGNSSGVFRVFDNGDVRNTNNSYGGISDQKLKENIVDANSQWNDIKSLSIRKYSLTHENSATPTQIGVIAQELESAGMNGLVEETVDRDEEGNDLGTTTKSVKYSVLYMKSVKALQEALIKIEDLEARIEALENA